MKYERVSLGRPAVFLLPSLKLKSWWDETKRQTAEDAIQHFLIAQFGGFTVTAGNIFGYWTGADQEMFYGEHRLYSVAFNGKEKIPVLEKFLAQVAFILGEQCIYLETGEDAWLIYPTKPKTKMST
ncbi:MAG: hypothetical protein AAB421_00435 [Patescibacteria group bacterium]